MDDDEQHLVMLERDGLLRAEDLVELQVLAVALGFAQIPVNLLVGQVDGPAGAYRCMVV